MLVVTSAALHKMMVQLLNLCILLSCTAKLANAAFLPDTDISVSIRVLTLSDWTDVTCCHKNKTLSHCFIYADSKPIHEQNSSEHCCNFRVSGEGLLNVQASEELRTTINVYCISKPDDQKSPNATITVWRLSLIGKYAFVFLVILGTLVLLSLVIFTIICIIDLTKTQGFRGRLQSASYKVQETANDNQGANPATEVQEEKTEIIQEELLYATVNYSGPGENCAPAVEFESGTVYATVVIN